MFKFDKSKFSIEYVGLKSLSKATIDPTITFIDSKGIQHKLSIPTSVARIARNRLHGVSRFTTAYPACVMMVDGKVTSLDVAVAKDYKMFIEFGEWISVLETREEVVRAFTDDMLWDGQYVYSEVGEVAQTGDTNFGTQELRAFNMYKLGEPDCPTFRQLAALCFMNPLTKKWVKTGPVTRHSSNMLQITGDVDTIDRHDTFMDADCPIEEMDRKVFVNMRFVNYSARVLARQFGYDTIEPLGLPLLMIEHRTFNLGSLEIPVQVTSPAPMSFSNALAWVVGLIMRVNTIDDLITVKQTMKMLLTKGNTSHKTREMVMNDGAPPADINTKEVIEALRSKMESAALVNFDE